MRFESIFPERLDISLIANIFSAVSRTAADTSVFHAIADPTRRAVLDLLREGDQTVMSMLGQLKEQASALTQSAFSQHLAVLRRARLVEARKEGRMRVYSIRPEPLEEVSDWVTAYDRFWTAKLNNLKAYLAKHGVKGTAPRGPDQPATRNDKPSA
jgi:DNA-binding transcriptional ArsR family regulator